VASNDIMEYYCPGDECVVDEAQGVVRKAKPVFEVGSA
jgi:hypothetical protein